MDYIRRKFSFIAVYSLLIGIFFLRSDAFSRLISGGAFLPLTRYDLTIALFIAALLVVLYHMLTGYRFTASYIGRKRLFFKERRFYKKDIASCKKIDAKFPEVHVFMRNGCKLILPQYISGMSQKTNEFLADLWEQR